MSRKLIKIGTRYVPPFVLQGTTRASLEGWGKLCGSSFEDLVVHFDGQAMDSYRTQEDIDRLKRIVIDYAQTPKFRQDIDRCEMEIIAFQTLVQKKASTNEILNAFIVPYAMQGITYFLSNFWLDDIPEGVRDSVLSLCVEYREASDPLYQLLSDAASFDNESKPFILSPKGYEPDDWQAFLIRERYTVDTQDAGEELKGTIAFAGSARGPVRIVFGPHQFDKIQDGDILVTSMTMPTFMPVLHRIAGIVTDEGGITCHAAIVARELKIPTIVGTKGATKMLQDGQVIEICQDGKITLL